MRKTRTLKIKAKLSGVGDGDGGVKELLLVMLLLSTDAFHFDLSNWPKYI